MKYTSTFLFTCLLCSTASSQQWKFTGNYSLGLPQQAMGKNIQAVNGLQAGLFYRLPNGFKNFYVGLELGTGFYAHKSVDQTFMFENTSTVVTVNYNSNTFNGNLQTRFNFWDETQNLVTPYVAVKAGVYNFYSNIVVEDPHDPGGCTPLDKGSIINDKTMYWSAGGGFQVDPGIFSKNKRNGKLKIDIGAFTIRGGNLDYINTRHLVDAQSLPDPGAKPVTTRFINASSQHIHEHTVAQLYSSALRLFEIRAGVSLAF